MKQVRISEWYGRLGNNLSQLINAIYFAKKNKYVFVLSSTFFKNGNPIPGPHDGLAWFDGPRKHQHKLIDDFIVNFSDDISITMETIQHKNIDSIEQLFYDTDFESEISNVERSTILRTYVHEHFIQTPVSTIDDNTLVIHIRSGDIFNDGAHGFYLQPPYSFYKKIITENNYTKIHIITEADLRNPAIQMICQEHPSTIVQTSDLIHDCSVILQARHFLCNSQGSFGHMLSLMSKNITNLYLPYYLDPKTVFEQTDLVGGFLKGKNMQNFFDLSSITHFKLHEYAVYNYIHPFSWNPKNKEQIDKLKNLPIEFIVKI